jgi:hypothetical protein
MLIDGTDGFRQVSERFTGSQVELSIVAVQNPGEDRVLWEVVVGAVGQHVKLVNILHIRYLSISPQRTRLR